MPPALEVEVVALEKTYPRPWGSWARLRGHQQAPRLAGALEAQRLLDREVRTFSSGEKARVVLMRALLHRPRVLLLDGVTRSLDPGAARRLRTRLLSDASARGAAVLFASHDLAEVEAVAHRVLLLDAGRLAAESVFAAVPREEE